MRCEGSAFSYFNLPVFSCKSILQPDKNFVFFLVKTNTSVPLIKFGSTGVLWLMSFGDGEGERSSWCSLVAEHISGVPLPADFLVHFKEWDRTLFFLSKLNLVNRFRWCWGSKESSHIHPTYSRTWFLCEIQLKASQIYHSEVGWLMCSAVLPSAAQMWERKFLMRNNVFSISLDKICSVKNLGKKCKYHCFWNYKAKSRFSLFSSFLGPFLSLESLFLKNFPHSFLLVSCLFFFKEIKQAR